MHPFGPGESQVTWAQNDDVPRSLESVKRAVETAVGARNVERVGSIEFTQFACGAPKNGGQSFYGEGQSFRRVESP